MRSQNMSLAEMHLLRIKEVCVASTKELAIQEIKLWSIYIVIAC